MLKLSFNRYNNLPRPAANCLPAGTNSGSEPANQVAEVAPGGLLAAPPQTPTPYAGIRVWYFGFSKTLG